jgi:hypothetical protein
MAPMKSGLRTAALPAAMKALPRHCPDWRVNGRQAGQCRHLAAVERAELGQLGDERAGDRRADAGHGGHEILVPTPQGEPRTVSSISRSMSVSSFCSAFRRRWMLFCIRFDARFSRCPSATIIWMICRRRAIRSASAVVSASASGRIVGCVAWANRAITAASIGSVFARLPSAWAKARTCAGLTTTTGKPRGPQAGRHHALEARPSPPPQPSPAPTVAAARSARRSPPHRGPPRTPRRPAAHARPARPSPRRSRPRQMSILSHPCLNGLRLRPWRLFGFDGTAAGDPGSPTGSDTLGQRATDRHRDWHSTR